MTWTTDKPTVQGWYWQRVGPGIPTGLYHVYRRTGQWVAHHVLPNHPVLGVAHMNGEWAGPLEPPQ